MRRAMLLSSVLVLFSLSLATAQSDKVGCRATNVTNNNYPDTEITFLHALPPDDCDNTQSGIQQCTVVVGYHLYSGADECAIQIGHFAGNMSTIKPAVKGWCKIDGTKTFQFSELGQFYGDDYEITLVNNVNGVRLRVEFTKDNGANVNLPVVTPFLINDIDEVSIEGRMSRAVQPDANWQPLIANDSFVESDFDDFEDPASGNAYQFFGDCQSFEILPN